MSDCSTSMMLDPLSGSHAARAAVIQFSSLIQHCKQSGYTVQQMSKLLIMWFFLLVTGADTVLASDYFSFHAKGWHWYQIEPEPEDKKLDSQKDDSPLERLKKYQRELEEAKAEAVLTPTPANVARYQHLQYAMLEKAGVFAKVWMQNVHRDPSLDYAQQVPVSQGARHIYLREQQKQKEQKIQELSKKYGLFFFFKSNCPYCEAFGPTVKSFSEKYDWEVLAISEFGEQNQLFARNLQDNGLAETWGVNTYPSLFAVNPENGHVIPIAVGMISIEEMEERILSLVGDENTEVDS